MRGGKKRFCIVPFVSLVIGDACRVLGMRERSNFEQLNLSGFKHTHSHADLAQLIRRNGYAVEEHFAETSDGYVLGLHRLPSSKADGGTPVVLQHGLLDSAATWVVNDAKHSLGFILADHGYDVWLASSRGSTFARNHTGWSTESTQFWDFSLDDMAAYDLPCTIEYVRRHTNGQAVALVAHSQGAALSLASLASGAIPPGHVKLLITLAPAVFLKYIDSVPLQFLASVHADTLFKSVGRREFLPTDLKTADLFGLFCTTAPQQCVSILTAICGFNPSNVDASRLPVYLAWAPSGTSVKNMAHWAQRVRDAQVGFTFRKYDYGRICSIAGARVACNQHMYGHLQPPSYDLSAISKRSDDVKIAVFYGTEDILADPVDVRTVVSSLGDVAVYEKGLVGYTHLDFTWSLSAADEVYQDVLGLLTSY